MTSLSQKFISPGLTLLLFTFVLQWECMQVGVWINMIRDYSQDSTLKTAVSDTFSGEKPCEKCLQLTRSQTGGTEDTELQTPSSMPPDLAAPEKLHLPAPSPGETVTASGFLLLLKQFSLRPPVPPPRFS